MTTKREKVIVYIRMPIMLQPSLSDSPFTSRHGRFHNFWSRFGSKEKLGSESEPVPRDSKKNIRIKENNETYGLFKLVDLYAKEFQVSTANAVMIMLFNLKYVSGTLRKLYGKYDVIPNA